ncbi:MAG TPA: inorganic diphosphatase [Longimicrobiales bacterium]|nr:inorganic diphosphatase [Longimicrobiales bacterium]
MTHGFHPWHDLDVGDNAPNEVQVFIEIPAGSRNKYELDKKSGLIKFDRLLYSSVHYPGDYGFIPRTLADDDDPLDVVVITTDPTFPGCLMHVRPIGVFEMRDDKGLDEKVLCVPLTDPLRTEYFALKDVRQHYLREVEHFFAVYKELEDKQVELLGWQDVDRAHEVIVECMARYEQQKHGLRV